MISPVIVVPHYEHVDQLRRMLPALRSLDLPVIIIDDGSQAATVQALEDLVTQDFSECRLLRLPRNRGKGSAVMIGFAVAAIDGYSHVIQVDADGQHDLNDVRTMLEVANHNPAAIVSGRPVFGDDMPGARRYGKLFGLFWIALETLSLRIKDGMCGFRVYPLAAIEPVIDRFHIGPRMDFDIEILVKADWVGIPVRYVDTRVNYPDDGKSHFHYLTDNVDITIMHIRLLLGMLPRAGKLLYRSITGEFR